MNTAYIDSLLEHFVERGVPGCSLGISYKGEVIYRGWAGNARLEDGEKVNKDTVFQLYSNSKNITTVALLRLYEQGKFLLNDRVDEYLPFFKDIKVRTTDGSGEISISPAKNPLRIKNLLTMTAGIPYDGIGTMAEMDLNFDRFGMSTMEVAKRIAKVPLDFEPGTHYHYGLTFEIVAALCEVLSGKSFADFLDEMIFSPLGMKDTTFILTDDIKAKLATTYEWTGNGLEKTPSDYAVPRITPNGPKCYSGGEGLLSTVDDLLTFATMLGMIILCAILNENFLSLNNFINIFTQMSFTTIAAFAMTILLITGNMDLALGSTMALAGIASVVVYKSTGSLVLSILVAIFFGVVCGGITGFLINKLHLHPFIVGLGTKQIYRGVVLLYTGGAVISQVGDFKQFGQGRLFGVIPYPILIMLGVMVITWILLEKTKFGRNCFAVGGNREAAIASGINANGTVLKAFLISGVFIGLAGMMLMSRTASGYPNAADGYEMDAMTAAVIGGTSFTGGVGTAIGTLIGGLIVAIINNILTLMGVQSYVQQILKGAIVVIAVAIDVNSRRKKMGQA